MKNLVGNQPGKVRERPEQDRGPQQDIVYAERLLAEVKIAWKIKPAASRIANQGGDIHKSVGKKTMDRT